MCCGLPHGEYVRKSETIFLHFRPEQVAEGLVELLTDTEANGKCLIVKKDGRKYATFGEEMV